MQNDDMLAGADFEAGKLQKLEALLEEQVEKLRELLEHATLSSTLFVSSSTLSEPLKHFLAAVEVAPARMRNIKADLDRLIKGIVENMNESHKDMSPLLRRGASSRLIQLSQESQRSVIGARRLSSR
jgi:hypothetical protein